jgi:serine/threonine-protein kinase HipA
LELLETAEPGARQFSTVRFAPLYDAVTTRVFPNLAGDRMALKLNGKDDRLTRKDFITLARTIDLPVTRAEALISETTARLGEAAPNLALPRFSRQKAARAAEDSVRRIVMARIEPLG